MDCRRTENLIPLYVEGDLTSLQARAVADHLHVCDRCHSLADQYRDSQAWLHAYAPPDFDSAFYNRIRRAVLKEIDDQPAPGWLQLFAQSLKPSVVFAVCLAVLFIFGAILFVISSGKPYLNAARQDQALTKAELQASRPETATVPQARNLSGAAVQKSPAARPVLRPSKKHPRKLGAAPLAPETTAIRGRQSAPPLVDVGYDQKIARNNVASDETALKIEIQTSDPNIRIIWFAPKAPNLLSPHIQNSNR
jgi:hypothetical protein